MKPDFGLMILKGGLGSMPHYFYDVLVTHLSASAPGLFTFLVNTVSDGVEYAVSFDFDSSQVADLLRKAEGRMAELSVKLAQAPLGDTIEFEAPIVVNIEATLGKLQRTDKEDFVPFVVSRVA